jgi:hypothetical protein
MATQGSEHLHLGDVLGAGTAAFSHLSIAVMAMSNWAMMSARMLPPCAWPTTPAARVAWQ